MKKIFRHIIIGSGIALLIMVIIGSAVPVWLKTSHFRRFCLERINASIPGTLRIGQHRVSLLKGRIDLVDLSLTAPSGSSPIKLDRLSIDIKYMPIWRKEYHFSQVLLDTPQIDLSRGESGSLVLMEAIRLNSPRPSPSAQPFTYGTPIPIVIEDFNCASGSVAFQDKTDAISVDATDINLNLSLDGLNTRFSGDLKTGRVTLIKNGTALPLDRISVAADVDGDTVDPVNVVIGAGRSELCVAGQIREISTKPLFDLDADLQADLADVRHLGFARFPATGLLNAKLHLQGPLSDPATELVIEHRGGIVYDRKIDHARLEAGITDRRIWMRNLTVKMGHQAISGSGSVDVGSLFPNGFIPFSPVPGEAVYRFQLASGQSSLDLSGALDTTGMAVRAQVAVHLPDAAEISHFAGLKGIHGSVSLNADISGILHHPTARFAVAGNKLQFAEYTLGNMEIHGELTSDGMLRIAQMELLNQDSMVSGQGTIHLLSETYGLHPRMPLNFRMNMSGLDVKDFSEQIPMDGYFDGSVDITGDARTPVISASLTGTGMRLGPLPPTDGRTAFTLSNGRLSLLDISLSHGRASVHGTGHIDLFQPDAFTLLEDPTFQFSLQGKQIDLGLLSGEITGELNFSAELEGPVSNPAGKVQLHGKSLDLGYGKLDSLDLASVITEKKLFVESLKMALTPSDIINCTGWIAADRSMSLSVTTQHIDLNNIPQLGGKGISDWDLAFSIQAEGFLTDPDVKGSGSITHIMLRENPIPDVNFNLAFSNRTAVVNAVSNMDLHASYSLDKKDFRATLTMDRTRLNLFAAIGGRPDLDGEITGTMAVEGNMNRPADITAGMNLTHIDVRYKDKLMAGSRSVNVEIENKEFRIPPFEISVPDQGRLSISGNGRFDGPMNIEISGSIPLAVADPFVDEISGFNGNLSITASAGGTWPAPEVKADVKLEALGFTYAEGGQTIRNLNGRIAVSPKMIKFDQLHGDLDTGNFDATGTLSLLNLRPDRVNLVLHTHQVPVQVPDVMTLKLNTRLSLQGVPDNAHLTGNIDVVDAVYYKNVVLNLADALGKKERTTEAPGKPMELPYLSNTSLDLSIHSRNPVIVDNNMAYLEIRPDLRLVGTARRPVLNGRANVEMGEIYYRKKAFTVTRGVVDFVNPYKTEPLIDVKGRIQVRRWMITLAASGTPDNLKVRLSSDPPEADADILSLLLVGKTAGELSDTGNGGVISTKQMMAQLIGSQLGDGVKDSTGLDILEVDTAPVAGEEASESVRVTVGKNLTERMTIKYSVVSKDGETNQRAISEYHFLDYILINGFQDTNGVYGGELIFRMEFR
ncbi:MAG: AsmA family protein [Desulfobacteraceae bacterium]|nr:AsmA family protein [Desulfobacteraceae bacterium]